MKNTRKILIIGAVLVLAAGIILAKELIFKPKVIENTETTQIKSTEQKPVEYEQQTLLNQSYTFGMKNTADFNSEKGISVKKTFEQLKQAKHPFFIALSYEADCCEGTKRFFENYHKSLFPLFTQYKGKITSFYINVGKITPTQRQELIAIAENIKLEKGFPALILFNAQGNKKKAFIGALNESEVEKIVKGVLK